MGERSHLSGKKRRPNPAICLTISQPQMFVRRGRGFRVGCAVDTRTARDHSQPGQSFMGYTGRAAFIRKRRSLLYLSIQFGFGHIAT